MFKNSNKRFAKFQWYKDDTLIEGATKQYYSDPNGLQGSYSLKLASKDGTTFYSCSKSFNNTSKVKTKVTVFPNPVKATSSCTVEILGMTSEQMKNAKLSVYNLQGICVYESTVVENLNKLDLAVIGAYVGHITSSNNDIVFKIIVTK